MPKSKTFTVSVSVLQLTEPESIYEKPSYLARTEIGGVVVLGNRAESALEAAQSLFFVLTGAAHTDKAEEAAVGLSMAVSGTDLATVDAQLKALDAGEDQPDSE